VVVEVWWCVVPGLPHSGRWVQPRCGRRSARLDLERLWRGLDALAADAVGSGLEAVGATEVRGDTHRAADVGADTEARGTSSLDSTQTVS
jgi:N-formylglutamate amidohydrolase